ncbi:16387_t:CDS:2, partial [Entrophospora sp. SA101]
KGQPGYICESDLITSNFYKHRSDNNEQRHWDYNQCINNFQPTCSWLNRSWTILQQIIIQTADKEIPFDKISRKDNNKRSKDTLILHKSLKSFGRLLQQFLQIKNLVNINQCNTMWNDIKKNITKITQNLEIPLENLPDTLYDNKKIEDKIEIEKQIKFFTEKRCEHYTSNRKVMIDSILEREKQSIRINRCVINKDGEDEILLLPDDVKKATKNHFSNCTEVFAKPIDTSIRFLGVWVNAKGSTRHVKNSVHDEIINMESIMKHKHLTDKQILYIFNRVMIPRLEYCLQLTLLSENECKILGAKCRKLFKQKVGLASTVPNAVTNTHKYIIFVIYGIVNPLESWNYSVSHLRLFRNNLMAGILCIAKFFKFSLRTTYDSESFIIKGGQILLQDIFAEKYTSFVNALAKKQVLYLDQIFCCE